MSFGWGGGHGGEKQRFGAIQLWRCLHLFPLALTENNSRDERGCSIARCLLPLASGRKQPALRSSALASAASSTPGFQQGREVVSAEQVHPYVPEEVKRLPESFPRRGVTGVLEGAANSRPYGVKLTYKE